MKLSVVRKSLRSNGTRCRSLSGVGVHMCGTSKGKVKEKELDMSEKDIKQCVKKMEEAKKKRGSIEGKEKKKA